MSVDSERELPDGWRWKSLGDIAEVIFGQSPPGSTYRKKTEGLPFFQGKADFGPRYPIATSWCIEPKKIAQTGDILISVRAPVGPTNVADTSCCIGRGLAAIRCNNETDREFLLLGLRKFESEIAEKGTGSTFDAINRANLLALEIPLPPLPEQKRIAAILTDQLAAVDRARKASVARLEAARALPAAYLREVFESKEAKGWGKVPIGELVSTKLRTGLSKTGDSESSHRCLTLSSVRNGTLLLDKVSPANISADEAQRYQLNAGAFYVVRGNGNRSLVGRGGIAPQKCEDLIFPDLLFEVNPDPQSLSTQFLRWVWDSEGLRSQIEEKSMTAAGIYKINQRNLASIELPLPALPIQQRIASRLDQTYVRVTEIQAVAVQELAAINATPASLLRQAFSGAL